MGEFYKAHDPQLNIVCLANTSLQCVASVLFIACNIKISVS